MLIYKLQKKTAVCSEQNVVKCY